MFKCNNISQYFTVFLFK